jgi:hypothetical protein
VVTLWKAEVRKRLQIPGAVADVAAVPEATSASYLKRLAPRQTTAAGNGGRAFRALRCVGCVEYYSRHRGDGG